MNVIIFWAILVQLLVVSYFDVKTSKIRNYWPLINLLFFFIVTVINREFPGLSHFYFPVGMIVIGFILFLLNIMGAGDSKYIASIYLLLPASSQMLFTEKLLTVTIFVGTILLIMKFIKSAAKIRVYLMTFYFKALRAEVHSRISYAPVILVAWILYGIDLWQ